jgi:hypothetical protein
VQIGPSLISNLCVMSLTRIRAGEAIGAHGLAIGELAGGDGVAAEHQGAHTLPWRGLARLELARGSLATRARGSVVELHGHRVPQRGSGPERSCSACSTTRRSWWRARLGLQACEATGR